MNSDGNLSPGLCARCANAKVVCSDKGSEFLFCLVSYKDPGFPKYPRLPVQDCAGFLEVKSIAAT
jgi:hypothetical protein